MKYALIGCGMISASHLKAAVETGVEIAALCDLVPENRKKALESLPAEVQAGVTLYDDYHKMLREVQPDLVAVALGSGVKCAIVCDCLRAGAHVIVEKPIALSLEEADTMIRTAEECGRILQVNHQLRCCPSVRAIKAQTENGSFGRMLHASAQVRRNRNKAYFDAGKWRGSWKDDGGTMMNQCIHYGDLLVWILGEVEEVFAYTDRMIHPYVEAEDMGLALIRFRSGAYAMFEGTINAFPRNLSDSMAFFGESGTVSVSGKYLDQTERWAFADGSDSLAGSLEALGISSMGEGHTPIYRDTIEAIETGSEPICSGAEGRRALELILGIYESAATGQPVKFPLTRGSTMDYKGRFDQ